MRIRIRHLFMLILFALPIFATGIHAQDNVTEPHAYAVLFHSYGCPHCIEYIENQLPLLENQFGADLTVMQVSIDDVTGRNLAMSAYEYYAIPQDNWVVPMMVVNDEILIGGLEIPARAEGIIRDGLAAGGIDLPAVAGMRDYYQARYGDLVATSAGASSTGTSSANALTTTLAGRLGADPIANGVAIAVLLGLFISFPLALWDKLTRIRGVVVMGAMALMTVIGASILLQGAEDSLAVASAVVVMGVGVVVVGIGTTLRDRMQLLPFVSIAGLVTASYLAYIELAQTEATCGLVGNCNAVQQSPYAYILGVLPVGVLGVVGYLAILGVYVWRDHIPQATVALRVMVGLGMVFSAYLTFLEPFVIGATCMWCIMSALTMLALWWLVAPSAGRQPNQASITDREVRGSASVAR